MIAIEVNFETFSKRRFKWIYGGHVKLGSKMVVGRELTLVSWLESVGMLQFRGFACFFWCLCRNRDSSKFRRHLMICHSFYAKHHNFDESLVFLVSILPAQQSVCNSHVEVAALSALSVSVSCCWSCCCCCGCCCF